MKHLPRHQQGFVLIVSLILLVVLTLLVVNGMGATTMGEQMAGNHLDRARAHMAAQQAVTQGLAVLQANGDACILGCDGTNGTTPKSTVASPVSVWSDVGAHAAISTAWSADASDPAAAAQYSITWQDNPAFDKPDCKAYSVMGRGVGFNVQSVVVLQTIAYVCPTD